MYYKKDTIFKYPLGSRPNKDKSQGNVIQTHQRFGPRPEKIDKEKTFSDKDPKRHLSIKVSQILEKNVRVLSPGKLLFFEVRQK